MESDQWGTAMTKPVPSGSPPHVCSPSRRQLLAGGAATAGSVLLAPWAVADALAQDPGPTMEAAATPWRQLNGLVKRAQKLGLAAPRMSAGPVTTSDDFRQVMPAIVDFMKGVESGAKGRADSRDVEAILDDTSELVSQVLRAERPASALGYGRADLPPGARAPSFDDIKSEYETTFAKCKVRADRRTDVNWCVKQILDNKARYQEVEDACCVPWFAVAIIHGMECSFSFYQHLHNGDSIKKKTWQVPSNRPSPWNPPTDWNSSAIDALRYDKVINQADWSLARTLYRWEGYNGWGTRGHGIKTPYLWSFSDQYSKGKYVADGKWDGSAISKQCGAAVMLRVLVDKGEVTFA